jgi:hypothetical protein
MLERHWPWLVSVAAPAVAAMLFLVWVAVAPHGLELQTSVSAAQSTPLLSAFDARDLDRSHSLDLEEFASAANEALKRRQIQLFHELDHNADGLVSADEYHDQLLALTELPASRE